MYLDEWIYLLEVRFTELKISNNKLTSPKKTRMNELDAKKTITFFV